jgi:hypothetical protein
MAKAILEFDLTEYDDRIEHQRAVASTDLALMVWEILYNTRKEMLYAIEAREMKGETVSPYDAIEMYRQKIGEIAEEHNINIDKLIQ